MTIQQDRVMLKLNASIITFVWPLGSDEVQIYGDPYGVDELSPHEAADYFDLLWEAGWR